MSNQFKKENYPVNEVVDDRVLSATSEIRQVLPDNPVIQRALRRLKESQEKENHVSHYTKHGSHSTHSKGSW